MIISLLDEQWHIVAYLDGLYPGGHLRQAEVNALREETPTVPPSAGHLPPWGEAGGGWWMPSAEGATAGRGV